MDVGAVMSWVTADGNAYPLFGDDIIVTEGVSGLRSPPARRDREPLPGIAGTRLRQVAHDMRVVDVPVLFSADSPSGLRDLLRAWAVRLDPTAGDGLLNVGYQEGPWLRELVCRCVDGMDVDNDGNRSEQATVLVFEADDPYWYDIFFEATSWVTETVVPKWFDPDTSKSILPLALGASAVLGSTTVNVRSDIDVWPVWTVDGPGSALVAINNTPNTPRTFAWDGTLADGDQLVVDARPGAKTVKKNGVNAFSSLSAWDLWPLAPGTNDIDITLAGTTTASKVTVQWRNAYLAP